MNEPITFTLACIVAGGLLIAMTLGGSFIARLPLSAAMLYLGVGVAISPVGLGLLKLDALKNAVLLGAILAPTDPVLASDVQVANPGDRDRLRFGLTGEGGLNDGAAFPFVMLGLGLLGLHELGEGGWRWWAVDVVWAVTGGLALGWLLGTLVGRAILYLRMRHREALGSDEFIALGLIGLTYGVALLCRTYGFLAVFAAGLALRRIDEPQSRPAPQAPPGPEEALSPADQEASGAEEAPTHMMRAVERFNSQLESFVEVAIVLAVGGLVATTHFRTEVLWFIPVLFLMLRPVAVYIGLLGTPVRGAQRNLMSWFGIRGIGSLYYLLYAINHGIERSLAQQLLSISLAVVVASVIAHGISVTPLMKRYEARKPRRQKHS